MTTGLKRPSNQVGNNHHRQQWDTSGHRGQCLAGQAGNNPGSPLRDLASGRRGRAGLGATET